MLATMTIPTPGRIVLYTLAKQDADTINTRRSDAKRQAEQGPQATGFIVHSGNSVTEGDIYPLVITKVWSPNNPTAAVNGQLLLDGNDTFWVMSACAGEGPRTFIWPHPGPVALPES